MQFDHVWGVKKFNVGADGPTRSIKQVLDEIAKCQVVCANCHAERTFERLAAAVDDKNEASA
jgi:hypothetical protein